MSFLVGYVTPQDYGATGNGSTDDTAAIQAALTAVQAAGGGTVLFPYGTYKISSALSVPSLVSLLGVGPNASVINQTSTSANGITYNPASLSYASIEDLTITGPGSGTGVGVLVEANSGAANVTSCSFQDVTISGFGSHGFELVNGVGCQLNTVNVSSVGGHGLFLSGGTGNSLSNCFTNGGASTQQGFQLTSANYTTLNGCKAFGCGGGFQVTGGSANQLTGCGADTIVAANGQDGSGFKINGGTVHTITSCYSNINKAVAFYVTGSAVAATVDSVQEFAPSSATASIKVDAGSTAAAIENAVVTATSYAAGTTTVLSGGAFTLTGPTRVSGNLTVGSASSLGDNGSGELQVADATTVPTTNPTGGGVVYSESATATPLKVRDTAGNVRSLVDGYVQLATSPTFTLAAQTATPITLAVQASATYLMEAGLVFSNSTGSTTPSWTGPTGATMQWNDTGTSTDYSSTIGATNNAYAANASTRMAFLKGILTVSSTSGSLTLTLGVSTGTTTLSAGSFLRLTRVK